MGQRMKTAIEGLTLTELSQFADKRGSVLHMVRSNTPDFAGFGECYFSEVAPGAIKAWKRHRLQTQNLAVPIGRIRLVVYDDRPDSSTYGKIDILELGRPETYARVRIPPGLWYGFANFGRQVGLIVNCTDIPHDPLEGEGLSHDDPKIPYRWAEREATL